MRLQVLIATMGQTDLRLVEQMNLRCDAVIANQADRDEVVEQDTPYGRVRMVTTSTRGVGRNRNLAIEAADGDILLMADDDLTYREDMPQQVLKAFAENPKADAIVFSLELTKEGKVFDKREYPKRRLHWWNAMRVGACRLAVRREALQKAGLTFHESFGGGCPFSAGEDSLFVKSCFDKGLRVYAHPYVLGSCRKDASSWFVGYNEKYFYDKGVLVRHLFPRTAYLMALYFGAYFKRETKVGLWKRLRLVYAGVHKGKKLIPYQETL